MDLRDQFAAQFAAALVDAFADAGQVARRAYDLAEAMMVERARRMEGEERSTTVLPPVPRALLDEPVIEPDPGYDDDVDPSWLEPPYDPSWDLETRWTAEASPRAAGPGLARTTPGAAPAEQADGDERKERTA
jgi:hypothetical protein